ncbi:putative ATP-dependent helicase [Staphylococcus piscifermentans]|uniref:Uncharacterized protein n=1 Tax=Staphylococcus piscifermentans TaxID=70258 RepID=A0A239UFH9_9STAP|nr:DEAD/DEAH box helicase family protein [Staphylococcus piscifermentans]RTX86468.1 DNA/RNA helicase [Staphylococcus piscifermentans]GEP83755.1 hypothetical protein SPI02_03400 [Staphylococcus piscifermentans]SNV07733.1 putative ATP-dependent helicase [Staphylococcus piscifermentans]
MIEIKHYGKLIRHKEDLSDETIRTVQKGVIKNKQGRWQCIQCESPERADYYTYYSEPLHSEITYCRHCLQLGRMDTHNDIYITDSRRETSKADYHLDFQLSEQQTYASENVIRAIQTHEKLLLYAVTGAGKTEMMFAGIQYARQQGYNVAVISPRVDVVVEISARIAEAFSAENIDVLYQGQSQQYNGHFVVATVHQLYRFKHHFDVIFIDEVDAFPLSMDPLLMKTINSASVSTASHIYMTATPSRKLRSQFKPANIITLPARYHRRSLPVPTYRYLKFKPTKLQHQLLRLFQQQINIQRYTLVFFNHIEAMKAAFEIYAEHIPNLIYVHSEDALRFDKVTALREGRHPIVFTTTILERGFTMPHLDVIVLESQTYSTAALVQIAGRVGRKMQDTSGLVLYLHNGVSISMLCAKAQIKQMNTIGLQKGWLDA